MTSIAAESVATILCSCKQTRFHIENPNYRELDIEGLNITVSSGEKPADKKGKGKAKGNGVEILSDAKLRLKAGQRYALVGRNGSGKSTLLRAIAERLIPGIPEETRISILQQTDTNDASTDDIAQGDATGKIESLHDPTVLEEVIDKATARSELEHEIRVLSEGVGSTDGYAAVHSLRRVRHERLQKKLFVLDKDARLRSGTRGMAARKALTAFEKVVAESEARLDQEAADIPPSTLQQEIQEAAELLSDLQLQVEPSKLASIESKAKRILTGLGFSEAYMLKPVSSLSGGWLMRTALATALLQETDILILDEPTNYLDLLGIIWLQRYLQSLESLPEPPTLILVSHDRDFISLATDLLILKEKGLTYFHGDLPTYEASQSERKLYLTKMKEAQDRQKQHMQETIARNIKAGKKNDDDNKLRQAKSRQKKLDDRMGMQVNARGGRFKLNRDHAGWHDSARDEIDIPQDERPVVVSLPEPAELRFPGPLVSLEGVAFRYPAAGAAATTTRSKGAAKLPPVLEDITLSIHSGDRIGILGLNGAGKSTLIKLLVQSTAPTTGTVGVHPRLKTGYYSQHAVETLQRLGRADPALTALSLLAREVEGELDEGELRGLLASFGLAGRVASDVPVAKLSGGQLVRCELARLLWRRPQLLVLDEVTTHLDYETVTALREALRGWEGAVVLVSHDRWFMRGVVEGLVDDDEEGDSEGSEGEREVLRRREVYRLKAGRLVKLAGGVGEFEAIMERRVKKLLGE
ncbi:ABC transporter [Coniochaeta sp. PMI_546]|nr:ABC transporter [Coniochaeta sp. PMI_546]